MHIQRIMDYLDTNVNEEERKIFNRLTVYVKKQSKKSFTMLVSVFNIDKKKFLLPPPAYADDSYVNKLEDLILYCKTIIEKKINISTFNPSKYYQGKQLDISTEESIDTLLKDLNTYNKYYTGVSVSDELVKNPLLILTLGIKKRFNTDLIEKHAFDYINNYALVEDNSASSSGLNYILDWNEGEEQPAILKDAIEDFYKKTGELYYISSEIGDRVSKDVGSLIRRKSNVDVQKSSILFNIFELILPCIAMTFSVLLLLITMISKNSIPFCNVLMTLSTIYGAFNLSLLLFRYGLKSRNEFSYSYEYYSVNKMKFICFSIFTAINSIIQFVYLIIYSDWLVNTVNSFGSFLNNSYYYQNNTGTTVIVITSSLGIVGISFLCMKFLKYHVPLIFSMISVGLLLMLIGVRMHLWEFIAFTNYTIVFTVIGVAMAMYLVFNYKKGKIKNCIILLLFLIDFLMLMISSDQFYLR